MLLRLNLQALRLFNKRLRFIQRRKQIQRGVMRMGMIATTIIIIHTTDINLTAMKHLALAG